jgi:hypothetical protein
MKKLTTTDYIFGTLLLIMIIFVLVAVNSAFEEILIKINLEHLTGFITSVFTLILIVICGYFYERKL